MKEELLQDGVLPRAEIVEMLRRHKVEFESWGSGTSRTLDDLFKYHERDKLHFRNGSGGGKLIIDVCSVVVIVIHKFSRKWLELYEDRQEFPNGQILRRTNFNGIADTMKRGEDFIQSAKRCLFEEVGFCDPSRYTLSSLIKIEHRDLTPSEKWPGITAAYHRHIFECEIDRSLFRRSGYVEKADDGRKIYSGGALGGSYLLEI